ncbi:MAG: hypothetical protein EG823_03015 [Actinobacteria bacterium]|nr:hypothetical protein [Actinomycetota bacterium]
MCEGGLNNGQMKHAVAMVNDSLAVSQEHLEQLHHLADHAGRAETSIELAQVTVMLGEAREKLDVAVAKLDAHAHDDVTVELL